MSVGSVWDLSSDAELITAVRSGESAAFGVLYERHVAAARAVARQYTNSAADADDAVQDAFSRVLSAIQGGGGPDVAFRAYLFTVLRRVALDRVDAGRRALPTDDMAAFERAATSVESSEEPTLAGFERTVVHQAYSSLPERWQAVLWYTEVEGLSAAEIAPILGLTANGVAALAYRAREGLRQAYLQQHLAAPASEACTLVNSKLGAYVRGGLAKRETALVDSHLEECSACRALVLELGDVNHGMRAVVAPLVLGAVAVGTLHGIGFGGAVGSAKAAALAGSAAGGTAPVGTTAAAPPGGTTPTGTPTPTPAQPVPVGAGAPAGTSAGATAGTSAGSAGGLVGAGAGAGTAAAGVVGGAAAGAGGLLAALAAAPALIAGVAAAVVIGVAVGVAGVLGVFSGSDEEPLAGSEVQQAEDDAVDDAAEQNGSGEPGAGDGATAPDDGAGTDEPLVAGPATVPADLADEPAPEPTPGTDEDPEQPEDPQDPDDPEEPDAPALAIAPIGAVSFVAGVAQPLDVTVTNTGGAAQQVSTEITFEPGVDWEVTATAAAPVAGAGAAAPTATGGGWTCGPSSATTALCTLPGLPAGATTTLHASILLVDDSVDLDRPVEVRVETFVAGGPRVSQTLTARVASPPAWVVAGAAAGVDLTGAVDGTTSALVTVPVVNQGRTTARDVHVTVALPADLPAGVSVEPRRSPVTGWACTPVTGGLDCTIPSLAPGAGHSLLLEVVVPALDLAAPQPLVDVDVATALTVAAAQGSATVPLAVHSAPAALTVGALDELVVQRRETRDQVVILGDPGGRTLRGVTAVVTLPPGVTGTATGPSGSSCAADGSELTCTGVTVRPGVPTQLRLALSTTAGQQRLGRLTVAASAPGGLTAAASADVRAVVPALALTAPLTATRTDAASLDVTFAVTNQGEGTAHDVTADLSMSGSSLVTFDEVTGPLGDGWECTLTGGADARCVLGSLAPGQTAELTVPATARVSQAAVSVTIDLAVSDAVAGEGPRGQTKLVTDAAGLSSRGAWSGGYEVVEIGAPVLGCDLGSAACRTAMGTYSRATNNGQVMVPLAESVAELDAGSGRVVFAGLYWSANRYAGAKGDAWSGPTTSVTLTAPDGARAEVTGERIVVTADDADREYYQSFADVTDVVAARGAGAWSVADVAVAASRTDPNRSYYGGWSLVVVREAPELDQDVAVYDGGAWIASGRSVTFGFEASAGRTGRIGVVAWDGDQGSTGDTLSLDGTPLTPAGRSGAPGSANDAFDSTAQGSAFVNSLGVDAKAFGPVPLRDGVNRLTAGTSSEQYLIGAVTVTSTRDAR